MQHHRTAALYLPSAHVSCTSRRLFPFMPAHSAHRRWAACSACLPLTCMRAPITLPDVAHITVIINVERRECRGWADVWRQIA